MARLRVLEPNKEVGAMFLRATFVAAAIATAILAMAGLALGSAHANPANCNPTTNPSDVYSPCWKSYIAGKEWETQHLGLNGQPPQTLTSDQLAGICREGLQELNPPDHSAFAQGCAEVILVFHPGPP
jgi:hypothetical protein